MDHRMGESSASTNGGGVNPSLSGGGTNPPLNGGVVNSSTNGGAANPPVNGGGAHRPPNDDAANPSSNGGAARAAAKAGSGSAAMSGWLDFEQPLVEVERRIEDLRSLTTTRGADGGRELDHLERKAIRLRRRIFSDLTPWQRVQLARHPRRPYALDYIGHLFTDFVELKGDRAFGQDSAVVAGLARFRGRPVVVIGHQKGRNTREKLYRNFGMPHPEGYRKALRVMQLAERFGNPILSFIDTPGAYPGLGAEERGQAEAIARNIREMTCLRVPILVFITGEGGSGGALAMAVGDRVFMLEYSFYSVISPEGCASILWNTREKAPEAAEALRFTAPDLLSLGVIDGVLAEPEGGAHRQPAAMAATIAETIAVQLSELDILPAPVLVERRRERYLGMGAYSEE